MKTKLTIWNKDYLNHRPTGRNLEVMYRHLWLLFGASNNFLRLEGGAGLARKSPPDNFLGLERSVRL